MANFFRLIFIVFLIPSAASAAFPERYWATYGGSSGVFKSALEACQSLASHATDGGGSPNGAPYLINNGVGCAVPVIYNSTGYATRSVFDLNNWYACPSNPGLGVPNVATACPDARCKDGTPGPTATSFIIPGATMAGLRGYFCSGVCEVDITSDATSVMYRNKDGSDFGAGWTNGGKAITTKQNGNECDTTAAVSSVPAGSSAENPTKDSDPTLCAESGGSWGQVGGVNKCVPKAPGSPPDGKSVETKKTNHDNGDGSSTETTTETTTECKDGVCQESTKTTTTTTGADGTKTTDTTTGKGDAQDASSFCKSNPKSPMCVSGKWSAGACDTAPTCDGDPVSCATAKSVWQTNCALTKKSDGSTAFDKAVDGSDGFKMPNSDEKRKIVNVGDMIKADNSDTPAQCLQDISFTVRGFPFTIELSKFCTFMQIGGKILLAISAIVSLRIIAS